MKSTPKFIKTVISPDFLDTVGKSFNFHHAKGVAELLKNSLDHYLRLAHSGAETRAGGWPALISLVDGTKQAPGPNMAVFDFGGTTFQAIEQFLLVWGDISAATHGHTVEAAVTGGHGNGGKFYMRQMWKSGARFLTWKDGRCTSLVVQRSMDGNTGFWEVEDEKRTWREAMEAAVPMSEGLGGAAPIIDYVETHYADVVAELDNGSRGFTVVAGRKGVQARTSNDVVKGNKWDSQRFVDELRDAPQARRPIRELSIAVLVNGQLRLDRIEPQKVEDDPEFAPIYIDLPAEILDDVSLAQGGRAGVMGLRKSIVPLNGKLRESNTIYITDQNANPVAFYPVRDLPVAGNSPMLSFFYGELQLTFEGLDSLIQNDRERLVPAPLTNDILEWVSDQILERAQQIENEQRAKERTSELQAAAILNDALNHHARRFLQQLETDIMVDFIDSDEGGGPGDTGTGTGHSGKTSKSKGDSGTGGQEGGGGTKAMPGDSQKSSRPKFPQVLLSGVDINPADPNGETKTLGPWHPPLEQDDEDRRQNVWWINTAHFFAEAALKHGGVHGQAFRSYQLFMFRDVVQHEALRMVEQRERELGLDMVENELTLRSNEFLSQIPQDLIVELLT